MKGRLSIDDDHHDSFIFPLKITFRHLHGEKWNRNQNCNHFDASMSMTLCWAASLSLCEEFSDRIGRTTHMWQTYDNIIQFKMIALLVNVSMRYINRQQRKCYVYLCVTTRPLSIRAILCIFLVNRECILSCVLGYRRSKRQCKWIARSINCSLYQLVVWRDIMSKKLLFQSICIVAMDEPNTSDALYFRWFAFLLYS